MERIRNSKEKKLRFTKSAEQQAGFKPIGLWYGIGNSWHEWCRSEMPDWIKPYNHQIYVKEEALLILKSVKEIKEFTIEYGIPQKFQGMNLFQSIDWKKVAAKHCGIEINPFQHSIHLDMSLSWYYGWDCSSGCIWHHNAITGIKRIRRKIR